MASAIFFFVIVIFFFTSTLTTTESKHINNCRYCGFYNCLSDPVPFCFYGYYVDNCGRTKCAKGPGERCGGPSNFLGVCGAGMYCHEEEAKCFGCSHYTLNCHS